MQTSFFRKALFPIAFSILIVSAAAAQDETNCAASLQQADAAYVDGRFDRTLQLADDCIRSGSANRNELAASYRLLALAYIKMDRLGEARMAVLHLLNEVPEYTTDPIVDPPDYAVLVESVRSQFQPPEDPVRNESWFASNARWVVGGGAALLGGVLAAILLQGGDAGGNTGGDAGLPPPPALPH